LALRPECVDCLIGTGSYYYAPEALPSILRHLAMVLGVRGDLSRSIRDLETAADKGEFAQTEAKIVLLGIYYNEKWFDKYKNLVLSLINQYPSNPLFYRWLTDFYLQQRQCEEGIRFFSGLLTETSMNPKFQVSRNYAFLAKGRLELERKALDAAVSSFTRGIEVARGNKGFLAQVHLLRGFALDLLGRRDLAIREYQTVLALPNVEETHRAASRFSKAPYQGRL
jgi:tetratricopeptide (TPR) repeat protein